MFSFLKANSKEVHKLVTEQENSVANRERIPFQDLYTLDSELEKKKELMAEEDNMISFLYDIGLEDEIKIMEMTEDLMGPVLRDHEVFNIDVPSGRKKFIDSFRAWLKNNRSRKQLYVEDTSEPYFYYRKNHEDEDGIKDNLEMIEMTNNEPAVKALEPM